MQRVVLDTLVIVAGLRSRRGAAQALLRLIGERLITPLAAPALFLEYEEVLKRPEQRLATGLSIEQIDLFLAALSDAIEPVELHYRGAHKSRTRRTEWCWKSRSTDVPMPW